MKTSTGTKSSRTIFLALAITAVLVLLSACTLQQSTAPGGGMNGQGMEEVHGMDGMHSMPGHDDGSGNMTQDSGFLPGEGKKDSDILPVRSTTIIYLKNGDEIDLTADILEREINGIRVRGYGYNGMVPGPVLKASQGDRVTVNFRNNLDQETTIHWHGLRHDNADDGVPGVTQESVQPGETFTYELYFPDDGAFWYHPHVREDIQQDAGLAGSMLVMPSEGSYNDVNREEFLVLDDILMDERGVVPYGGEHANHALMGRYGNVMLLNGDDDYELDVHAGDVVRFYITNVANARPFNFSIEGAEMKLVGGDLGLYEQEEFVSSVVISPAERYIVEAYFPEEGEYDIVSKNPQKAYVLGKVTASGEREADYSAEFMELSVNQETADSIEQYRQHFDRPVDHEIILGLEMSRPMEMHMEEIQPVEWEDSMPMMNPMSDTSILRWILQDNKTGKKNMDLVYEASVGEVLKFRLFNDPEGMHPMQHPFHVHGQRFLVTHIDGVPVGNKVWKDTVMVPAGSTVDILVDISNPGKWMMHCHIAEHLEAGMMTMLEVKQK